MITYCQLNSRLSDKNIGEEDCYKLLSDFGELLLTSANLIKTTKESESYEPACKLINSILIEFLIDKNSLILNSDSLLINILNNNILSNDRREYYFVVLKSAIRLMKHIIIISENDKSLTSQVFDDFNNYYLSFQDLCRNFKPI